MKTSPHVAIVIREGGHFDPQGCWSSDPAPWFGKRCSSALLKYAHQKRDEAWRPNEFCDSSGPPSKPEPSIERGKAAATRAEGLVQWSSVATPPYLAIDSFLSASASLSNVSDVAGTNSAP